MNNHQTHIYFFNDIISYFLIYNFYSSMHYIDKKYNLQNSIEYIKLPHKYNYQIKNIPKKLKQIKCNYKYEFINNFINYKIFTNKM